MLFAAGLIKTKIKFLEVYSISLKYLAFESKLFQEIVFKLTVLKIKMRYPKNFGTQT